MENQIVKVKFIGNVPMKFWGTGCPFMGVVKKGDVIDVSKKVADELKNSPDLWETKEIPNSLPKTKGKEKI